MVHYETVGRGPTAVGLSPLQGFARSVSRPYAIRARVEMDGERQKVCSEGKIQFGCSHTHSFSCKATDPLPLVLRCVVTWLTHSPAHWHKPPARAYPGMEARTGRQGRYACPGPWAAKPMPGRCATGAGITGITIQW